MSSRVTNVISWTCWAEAEAIMQREVNGIESLRMQDEFVSNGAPLKKRA
jgi:hypothetical protein